MSRAARWREEGGALRPPAVVGGTVALLALAFVVAVLLPILDGASASGGRAYDELSLAGRTLYIREGCFTCHTQAVRDAFSDSQLGPAPSAAERYANEAPNLIGTIRLGPDLACVGDREDDVAWFERHLRNPRAVREHSTMPSYAYLSDAERRALAAYLAGLTCGEA